MYIQACNSDIHGLDLVIGVGEITLKGQCKTPKQTKTQDSNNRFCYQADIFFSPFHTSPDVNVLGMLIKGYWVTNILNYIRLEKLEQKNGLNLFLAALWDCVSLKISVSSPDLLRGFHPFGKHR